MQTCNKCHQTKDFSFFNRNCQSDTGYRKVCKSCMSEYRKQNAEHIRQQKLQWATKNKEHVQKHRLEYYLKNKERLDAYKKAWNLKNTDKVREYALKSALRRKGKPHPWHVANPDLVRLIKQQYKHRRRQKENSTILPTNVYQTWVIETPKICTYCGTTCAENYHVDHIDPLSKSGTHTLDNLTISCPDCNLSKSNRILLHWLALKRNNRC